MSNEITQSKEDGIVHVRISGVMTTADQRALEVFVKDLVDDGQKVRALVALEHFEGWTKDEAWGEDLEFQFEYGNKITKIAIVGDPRWKEQALLFVGKGFRETEIEFFPSVSSRAAESWVRS